MPIVPSVEKLIRKDQNRYYGKYRAVVEDTNDPEGRGRVRLIVANVTAASPTDWAEPCVPYGGGENYGTLHVPPKDSHVFVEFIEGDASSPVWVGGYWPKAADLPEEYKAPTTKVQKTESGHFLTFEDEGGGETITLHSAMDAEIVMDPDGGIALTDSNKATVVLDAKGKEITIDDANGNTIVLSSSGITCTDVSGNEIKSSAAGVDITSSAVVNIEGSQVTVAGSGGEPLIKGATFLSLFNAHTHATGVGPSGPPLPPLTPSVLTTKSTAQ